MPTVSAPLRFEILDVCNGRIDMRLHVNSTPYDLTVFSTFSEPLRDLCDCLHDAISGATPHWINGEHPHFDFEWLGEGWLYEWSMRLQKNGELALHVVFSGNRAAGERKYEVWEITHTISPTELAEQLWEQCSKLIRTMGFGQYRQQWGQDFPLAQLLTLRALKSQGPGAPVGEELDLVRQLLHN